MRFQQFLETQVSVPYLSRVRGLKKTSSLLKTWRLSLTKRTSKPLGKTVSCWIKVISPQSVSVANRKQTPLWKKIASPGTFYLYIISDLIGNYFTCHNIGNMSKMQEKYQTTEENPKIFQTLHLIIKVTMTMIKMLKNMKKNPWRQSWNMDNLTRLL